MVAAGQGTTSEDGVILTDVRWCTQSHLTHVLLGGCWSPGSPWGRSLRVSAEGKTTGSVCVIHRVIVIVCVWSR